MNSLLIIFRKRNPSAFSIEKVYENLITSFSRYYKTEKIQLPLFSNGILSILKNILFIRKVKSDIYHISGDVHYTILSLPPERTVLTIHDLVFLETTKGIKRSILKLIFLDLPVRRARFITTISESSKNEILGNTHCNPDKIEVIPDPVAAEIYFEKKHFNKFQPEILFLGTKANKNLKRAINALSGISCRLHIVGKIEDSDQRLLESLHISYRNSYRISDIELANAYASADIVLFPSTYEGFGLPVIEAFKAGRVVVTSNINPMKTISEDAACLIDPLDIGSIKQGILKVKEEDEYRDQLIKKGFEIVKKYDPELIASRYMDLYNRMLSA